MTPTSSAPSRAAAPLDLPAYPSARRLDLVEDLHGHRVADPYRWLEDASSPETTAWSQAQDALWAAYRAQAAQIRCTVDAGCMQPLRRGLAKVLQMLQFIVHRASLRWLNGDWGINREQVREECSGG